MGIEGINNLKGYNMNEENVGGAPAQPTPPVQDPESAASTPANEAPVGGTPDAPADDDNQVIETNDPEPEPSNEDPGPDPAVPNEAAPSPHSPESVEADPTDQQGEGV